MLLNNIKRVIPQLAVYSNNAISGVIAIDGTNFPNADQSGYRQMFSVARPTSQGGSGNSCMIRVGTGTTTPAATDYSLDNDVTGSLTYISASANQSGSICNATMTYRNDTSDSITITEIGLCVHTGYTTQDYQYALMTRALLTTPITMAVGESRSFNVNIRTTV